MVIIHDGRWRHKLIVATILILLCTPLLVYAYTIDDLDPYGQTDFNLTYSAGGGELRYLEIPLNATVTIATVDIRGHQIRNSLTDDTEDSVWTSPTWDNPANGHDENWGTFSTCSANEGGTCQSHENFTMPTGIARDRVYATGKMDLPAFGNGYIYCLNLSTASSYILVAGFGAGVETDSGYLDPDCVPATEGADVKLNVVTPRNHWGKGDYYETKLTWNNGLAATYPTDPLLDVSNDGDAEWSYDGAHASVNTTADFSAELNEYLDSCGTDPCIVPFNFTINASGGILQVDNIDIQYNLAPRILTYNSTPLKPDLYNDTFLTVVGDDDDGWIKNVSYTITHPDGFDIYKTKEGFNNSQYWHSDLFAMNKTGVWNYSAWIKDNDSNTYTYNWTYNSTYGFPTLNESSWVFAQVPSSPTQGYDYLMVNASHDGNAFNTMELSVNGTELANVSKFWVTFTDSPANITGSKKWREFLINITSIGGNVSDGIYHGNIIFNRTNDQHIEFIPVTITISGTAGNHELSRSSYTTTMYNNAPHSWTFDVTNDGGTANLVGCNATFSGSMSGFTSVQNGANFDVNIGESHTVMVTHSAAAPLGTYADGKVLVNCTTPPASAGYSEKYINPVSITVEEYTEGGGGGGGGGGGAGGGESKRYCSNLIVPDEIIVTSTDYIEPVLIKNDEPDSIRYEASLQKPSLLYSDATPYLSVKNSAGIIASEDEREVIVVFDFKNFPADAENYKSELVIETDICEDIVVDVYINKKTVAVLPESVQDAIDSYFGFLKTASFSILGFGVYNWMILLLLVCIITPATFVLWSAPKEELIWRGARSLFIGVVISLIMSYGLMFII